MWRATERSADCGDQARGVGEMGLSGRRAITTKSDLPLGRIGSSQKGAHGFFLQPEPGKAGDRVGIGLGKPNFCVYNFQIGFGWIVFFAILGQNVRPEEDPYIGWVRSSFFWGRSGRVRQVK